MINEDDLFPEIIDVLLPYPIEEIESFCDGIEIEASSLNSYVYLVGMMGFLGSLIESLKGEGVKTQMARAISDMLLIRTENRLKQMIGGGEIEINAIKEAIRENMLDLGIKLD